MEFVNKEENLLPDELVKQLPVDKQKLLKEIESDNDPLRRWNLISKKILTPEMPFDYHYTSFKNNYINEPVPVAWIPTEDDIKHSNIGKMMTEKGFRTYYDYYTWSVAHREEFWDSCVQAVKILFDSPYESVFDTSSTEHGVKSVSYFPGAKLNIAKSCFYQRSKDDVAIVYASEADPNLRNISFAQLESLSNQIANSLLKSSDEGGIGLKVGDAVGICMPMTYEAVAIYIGIVKAGCAVVSIADSFSGIEIETRMRLANAKAIFTQDVIYRKDKFLPLFARIASCGYGCKTVILPGNDDDLHSSVINEMVPGSDFSWSDFLRGASEDFVCISCDPDHVCNILFSSGTTGEPKAIPWTHATPIKCAVDGYLHQDVRVGDVVAWPTNLGWMMGPWLLFQLINGATLALFGGVTSTNLFCKFVEDAKVNMLGVVPSLVKSWKASDATAGCDWSSVSKISSSGEASDPDAMLWLMSRAGYKPVIEYCGGTEIAGSYLSSTVVQPNSPGAFSSPVLGYSFYLLNEDSNPVEHKGEIALVPPVVGLSTKLLNRDHHDCYYTGMPLGPNGEVLRRHGDEIQADLSKWHDKTKILPAAASINMKYYRALGRCDDTMNIGGIKVSSVEIERLCNEVSGVSECAAIAISPSCGGPAVLVIIVVLDDDMVKLVNTQGQSSSQIAKNILHPKLQQVVRTKLNPLFHVNSVMVKESLPRTASNKVMRRVLRDEIMDGKV